MSTSRAAQAAAFAEGRRLREASRARRRAQRARARRRHPVARALVVIPFVLVMMMVMVLATAGFLLSEVAEAVGPAPIVVGAALLALHAGGRRRRALRRGGAPGTAPVPARPAARRDAQAVWRRARERFHALRAEYAAFECDAMEVLRLPALTDVSVPSTARFVDAFAEAQALETDDFPPKDHASSFVSAVDRAERAWRAAREAAERIRLSGLSPEERSTVERVIKLLTTARESDSDAERLAAYTRARAELAKLDRAGVIHVPRPAEAALEAASRGALPAA